VVSSPCTPHEAPCCQRRPASTQATQAADAAPPARAPRAHWTPRRGPRERLHRRGVSIGWGGVRLVAAPSEYPAAVVLASQLCSRGRRARTLHITPGSTSWKSTRAPETRPPKKTRPSEPRSQSCTGVRVYTARGPACRAGVRFTGFLERKKENLKLFLASCRLSRVSCSRCRVC
jgi:hypothetical protein